LNVLSSVLSTIASQTGTLLTEIGSYLSAVLAAVGSAL
jgi:hypothetical protein